MRHILFFLLATILFSCHKKKDDPTPVPVATNVPVDVVVSSSGYLITKVRYKIKTYADSNIYTYKTFDFSSYVYMSSVNSNYYYSNLPPKIYMPNGSVFVSPYPNGYYFSDTTTFDKGVLQGIEVTTQSSDANGNLLNVMTYNTLIGGKYINYTFPGYYSPNYGTIFQDSTTFKIPK